MKSNNNHIRSFILSIFIFAILCFAFALGSKLGEVNLSKDEFYQKLNNANLKQVIIKQNKQAPSGSALIEYKDGQIDKAVYYVSNVNVLEYELNDIDVNYKVEDVPRDSIILPFLVPILLAAIIFLLILFLLQSRISAGGGSKMMNFGKNNSKPAINPNVKFTDVAGLKEEKEELEEIVDFLKSPGKYSSLGARIPKGVLLVGPPGTGKTLLAKAVAGEAKVPFLSISGSDFVEMFVGVGASRVRDLFDNAKRLAPCIIFIDEIDAVARRRGSGLGGSHDEREQTLNQMLVEMDGFGVNEGIIVLAATNRVDILDPAILRPGRFDRKISVNSPDVAGREEILRVHAKNKPLSEEVNLKELAKSTPGFTGADLENLMNEAAILTAKLGRKFITRADIEQSLIKVGIGTEKRSKIVPESERKITAYHEAGHAILFRELPDVGPVHTISIIPTGMGAAGYTMPVPKDDNVFNTKNRILHNIMVSLGGRIAEELVFDDITTGASQDIRQATALAKSMVTIYGMSEKIGMINYDSGDEMLISRDFAQAKSYSDATAGIIDSEVKRIIDECYLEAKKIIISRRDILDKCADLLLEKEKIGFEEFEALFQ